MARDRGTVGRVIAVDELETIQEEPTQPWPTDEAGRPLDQWGLPINGPARAAALRERAIEDPALKAAEDVQSDVPPPPPGGGEGGQGAANGEQGSEA